MLGQDNISGVHDLTIDPPDRTDDVSVLKWRRRGDLWEGLVSREVDGKVITAWVPALMMAPVDSPGASGQGVTVGV